MPAAGLHLDRIESSTVPVERASLRDADLTGANLAWATLEWADLSWANLQGANLGSANLNGVDFSSANLLGAYIGPLTPSGDPARTDTDPTLIVAERLAQAEILQGVTLPDGTTYSGFLNLEGDLNRARNSGVTMNSAKALASFYGVSLDDYRAGQEWAEEHRSSFNSNR